MIKKFFLFLLVGVLILAGIVVINTIRFQSKQQQAESVPAPELTDTLLQHFQRALSYYRSFSYGKLADVIMLDERLEGRTKQAEGLSDPDLQSETRTMLGEEQYHWFLEQLKNSTATWKIIGNQVIFSGLDETFNPRAKGTDSWDGYPFERKRIADFIAANNINDILFLTGDTHASWAFEVSIDPKKYNPVKSLAVEFGTPSVSSANWDEYYPLDSAKLGEQLYLKFNPHLKYVNGTDHGYTLLTVYPDRARAQWYYVETLRKIDNHERLAKSVTVFKGSTTLK
jgi:alkaline phosphatase D